MKRKRNLEKWPYDVSHILYYATLVTYYNNSSHILTYGRDKSVDWK